MDPEHKLVLGGNVFGWTADEATSHALLDRYADAGGTMVDTADVYSAWVDGHVGGESERIIGSWLAKGNKDRIRIASKCGFMAGLKPDVVRNACEGSLARLGVERIDLYYLHNDDPNTPIEDTLAAFDALVKEGKIGAIGLSNFTPSRIDDVMAAADAADLTRPVALQPWYNMLEREKYEGELAQTAARHGLDVYPYYSLANGFLAGKYRSEADLKKSPRGLRNIAYLEDKGPRVLDALDAVAAEIGAAPASVALAWTRTRVTAPIASATSMVQLDELLASMRLWLSKGQMARLDEASA